MDAPGVSLRPKRLRRDVSPTKLSPNLEKSPSKSDPQCSAGEDKSSHEKPATVTNSPAAVTVKRNLAPKKWTLPEKMVFFEGVRQHGRCFLKISKLFEQKSKNKPEIQLRDTGQCRYFFTRSIKRLCLFPQINLDSGVRKKYMEILALVNYGEILRKTEREITKRTAENLNEMIYKGSTVMKMPGRVVRVKTPMCPVVKRFMKKKDMCSFVHLPQVVTMEFSPRKCIDHSMLRSATMSNLYTRLTVPITKTFAATLKLIEGKVRNHAFQTFKHLAGTSELVEPKLIFNLNTQSVAQLNYVEETDKVYTPSSFNGVEEMLAHGIGLTKEVTETAASSAKASQGINLSVQLGGETVVYSSSSTSPCPLPNEATTRTNKQTDTLQSTKIETTEPEVVYIANVKCASVKQYVRHPLDSANADGFYSYLRGCFCLESIPTDLTMAKFLVILKVPPIVQIQYAMNIDPLELSASHKLNPDIDAIINIGLMVSQSKRSQTPVMGSSIHAYDQDSSVQTNSDSGLQRKSSTEGPTLGRIGSVANCPIPGSSEDTQLQDHIMMLQSSGKVRLRNRLKFSQVAASQIESSLTNNTFMNDPLNDLSNPNPVQRRLPKVAPKLFNQITGSISLGPNNNVGKIILGNHTNGQRLSTIGDNGALSTCNQGSSFINIPFKHTGALQPIQLTHNQLETTYTNPGQLLESPVDTFPTQFGTPVHENHCIPADILDVAMKTAQVPQSGLQTANPLSVESQQVATVLPPLSEILPPSNEMVSNTGNCLVTSSMAQQQCSPVISANVHLPTSQVQLLHGCLASTQTFDASSDSFLSRRLDGEIEEMLNDNSVDVANKFDALLNSTESVLT